MDDIFGGYTDIPSMITVLRALFTQLRSVNLYLHPGKSSFGYPEMSILGSIVNYHGLRPDPKRFKPLNELLKVSCKRDARRTYGHLTYFRRVIKNFGRRAKILSDVASPSTPFVWTADHQKCVVELYEELKSVSLPHFDPALPCRVSTDGCALGISGEILMEKEPGKWVPYAFYSRLCTPAEAKWAPYFQELLAIAETLNHFRSELISVPFELITDAKSVTYILTSKSANPRTARFIGVISEFNITKFTWREGLKNSADPTSRAPCPDTLPSNHPFGPNPRVSDDGILSMICAQDGLRYNLRPRAGSSSPPRSATPPPPPPLPPPPAAPSLRPSTCYNLRPRISPAAPCAASSSSSCPPSPPPLPKPPCYDLRLTAARNPVKPASLPLSKQTARRALRPRPLDLPRLAVGTASAPSPKSLDSDVLLPPDSPPLPSLPLLSAEWLASLGLPHLRAEQAKDPALAALRDALSTDTASENEYSRFQIIHGSVFTTDSWPKAYIPSHLRTMLLQESHNSWSGHFQSYKMLDRLKPYFWPSLRKDAILFCTSCLICQQYNYNNKKLGVLTSITPNFVNEFIFIDIKYVVPDPQGYSYILVIVEGFTRFCFARPLKTLTAAESCEVLKEYVLLFGVPHKVLADYGGSFWSKRFQELLTSLGSTVSFSCVGVHSATGTVESAIRSLGAELAKFCAESLKDWRSILPAALFAVNTSTRFSLSCSPHELLMGYTPDTPASVLYSLKQVQTPPQKLLRHFDLRTQAHKTFIESQKRQKEVFNKNRKNPKFYVGQRVFVFRKSKKPGAKYIFAYKGPFVITAVSGPSSYYVRVPHGRRMVNMKYHVKSLKVFIPRPRYLNFGPPKPQNPCLAAMMPAQTALPGPAPGLTAGACSSLSAPAADLVDSPASPPHPAPLPVPASPASSTGCCSDGALAELPRNAPPPPSAMPCAASGLQAAPAALRAPSPPPLSLPPCPAHPVRPLTPLTICSWNVSSFPSLCNNHDYSFLHRENFSLICLQETMCSPDIIEDAFSFHGYNCFVNTSYPRVSYAGVATLSQVAPLRVSFGLSTRMTTGEGRIVTLFYPSFIIINCYVPYSGKDLANLDKRIEWFWAFYDYVVRLQKSGTPLIIVGDFNVAPTPADYSPAVTSYRAGTASSEVSMFRAFLKLGFIDPYRHLHPDSTGVYSCWLRGDKCRKANLGWRFDFTLISSSLLPQLISAEIHSEITGSDHTPISLSLML